MFTGIVPLVGGRKAVKATQSETRFVVGGHVKLEFGGRDVIGRIVEDLGNIGVRGRQLLRIEASLPLDKVMTFELPAEEVTEAKCHGHENGFRHLDPNSAEIMDPSTTRVLEPI